MIRLRLTAGCLLLSLLLSGCGGDSDQENTGDNGDAPPVPQATAKDPNAPVTPAELHTALKKANPEYSRNAEIKIDDDNGSIIAVALANTGVSDISPLKGLPLRVLDLMGLPVDDISVLNGMPLEELFLEQTNVVDLSPLKGLPLRVLHLNETKVSDISALEGMPLASLYLVQTDVADIGPLAGMPLSGLWLNDTQVTDIGPLEGMPLVTLTLHNAPVEDLSPLAKSKTLQRIHIAGTKVRDVSPLAKLPLTRLIFSPKRVKQGIDEVRKIITMRELGTVLENSMPPSVFWPKYDKGDFQILPD